MPIDKSKNVFETTRKVLDDNDLNAQFVMEKLRLLISGVVVLVVGHILGSFVSRNITRVAMDDLEDDDDDHDLSKRNKRQRKRLVQNVARTAYYIVMLVAITIVLSLLGIDIATIIAAITAVGFVLGMSLQGTLSDITSGIIIAFFQTYHVGDIIKVETLEGEVQDFRLINTVLKDIESKAIFSVPNSKMQGSIITNYTRDPFYVFPFTFNISNNNRNVGNIIKAMRKDLDSEEKYPEILRKMRDVEVPRPVVQVADVTGWGMQVVVRVPLYVDTDLVKRRGAIKTKLRQLLNDLDVTMMNRGETNLEEEKGSLLKIDEVLEKRQKKATQTARKQKKDSGSDSEEDKSERKTSSSR